MNCGADRGYPVVPVAEEIVAVVQEAVRLVPQERVQQRTVESSTSIFQ